MHLPIVIGTVPFRRTNYLIHNPRSLLTAFDSPNLPYLPAPPPPYSETTAPPPAFDGVVLPGESDEGTLIDFVLFQG